LGLAAIFFLAARSAQFHRAGIIFALCLYLPIVVYRVATLAKFWPVGSTTLAVAALEAALMAIAVALLLGGRSS
jgi:hypothetical protein